MGLTCEELFLVVRGRLEDLRILREEREESCSIVKRAPSGIGTGQGMAQRTNVCIARIRPLNPGGGERQDRDITTIHRLWVGSHR